MTIDSSGGASYNLSVAEETKSACGLMVLDHTTVVILVRWWFVYREPVLLRFTPKEVLMRKLTNVVRQVPFGAALLPAWLETSRWYEDDAAGKSMGYRRVERGVRFPSPAFLCDLELRSSLVFAGFE